MAIIGGVPAGVLVGDAFGWHATFLVIGALAAVSLAGVLAGLPTNHRKQSPACVSAWALARRPDVLAVLAVTILTVAGTFNVFTHLGVFMEVATALNLRGLALVLLIFGVASAFGARVGGNAADHWGAHRAVICGCALVFLAYLVLSLGAALGQMALLLPAIVLWGFASWGVMTAQQARLVALVQELAPVSLSLNSSAIYLGSAAGAAVGTLLVAGASVRMLGQVSAAISLTALPAVLRRR